MVDGAAELSQSRMHLGSIGWDMARADQAVLGVPRVDFKYKFGKICNCLVLTSTCIILFSQLTLKAPIATKVACFSHLLKCLRSLSVNSVNPDQTAPIGAVCSGSTLFASILNSSIMLGNYLQQRLQQTTFSDACFFWCFKG